MILEAAALALGAGLPLALSKKRSSRLLFDEGARDVAFYSAIGAGVLSAMTGSRTLGAYAVGAAGAWGAMKSDDVVRALP